MLLVSWLRDLNRQTRLFGRPAAKRSSYRRGVTHAVEALENRALLVTSDGFETNNTTATATNLGSISSTTTRTASIHNSSDQDFFKFQTLGVGTASNNVVLTISGSSDLDIQLLDSAGSVLRSSTGVTSTETIPLNGLPAGVYFVQVYGYSGAVADYSLSITPPPLSISADSDEANDTTGTATNLGTLGALTTRSNRTIHTTTDVDLYKFTTQAAGTSSHYVRIDFSHAVGDIDIDLLDSAGNVLTSSTGTSDREEISLNGRAAGTYFVKIRGYSGARGTYSLSINPPVPTFSADSDEANETTATATNLGTLSGLTTRSNRSIHTTTDVDLYKFTTQAVGTSAHYVRIDFTHSVGDLDIDLLDSAGNVLTSSTGTSDREEISLSGRTAGVYYLRVRGYSGARGNYSLSINSPTPTFSADSDEANETTATATDLRTLSGLTTRSNRSIHTTTDVDVYKFTTQGVGTSAHYVRIDFTHSAGDLDMDLLDSAGNVLTSSTGTTDREEITLNGRAAGVYYVRVRGYSGARGNYTLSINAPESSFAADRYEANETTATATDLRTVSGLVTQSNLSIHTTTDVDLFKFTTQGAGTSAHYARIDFTHSVGDIDMDLLDSAGNVLTSSTGTSNREEITLNGRAAGVYYVRVRGYSGARGNYTLSINAPESSFAADRYEANETTGTATDLRTVSGLVTQSNLSIHTTTDVDLFKFTTQGAGTSAHYVRIDFTHSVGDLDMDLLDSAGNVLSSSTGVTNREEISLSGRAAGVYFARVRGYSGARGNYSLSINAPVLQVTGDSLEPNDSRAAARDLREIQGTATYSNLSIHAAGNDDWYKFSTVGTGTSSDFVRIDFTNTSGDVDMALYDAAGTLLTSSTGTTNREQIAMTNRPAGVYFVRVYGYSNATNPNYSLSFQLPRASNGIASDRFEANDTRATATDLRTLEGAYSYNSLTIHSPTDRDFFKFTTTAVGTSSDFVSIDFTHSRGDVDMRLLDAAGTTLSSSTSTTNTERISLSGRAAGTYFIEVFGYSGGTNPSYTLNIRTPSATSTPDLAPDRLEANNTVGTATDLRTLTGQSSLRSTSTDDSDSSGSRSADESSDAIDRLLDVEDEFNIDDELFQDEVDSRSTGTSSSLSIHSGTDVDFFKFTTVATGTAANDIRMNLNNANGNLDMELLRSDGTTVISRAATTSNIETLSLNGLAAGTYYVRVYGVSGARNLYNLEFNAPTPPVNNVSRDSWTIMVYITASDLASYARDDINEMEQAAQRLGGSVNIAVMWDQSARSSLPRYATGNGTQAAWGTSGRAIITPDNTSTVKTTFDLSIGEQNTGSSGALTSFVNWATQTAPAERYALIMWDHGGGVFGFNYDNSDNVTADNLTLAEFQAAYNAVPQAERSRIELVAFDECLMAMAEMAHGLNGYTGYMVSSEEVIAGPGYNYSTAFRVLEQNANSTADQLASGMISSYQTQYAGQSADTLSAIRMGTQTTALMSALNAFTSAYAAGFSSAVRDAISRARNAATSFESSPDFRDLGQWMNGIASNTAIPQAIRTAATNVRNALSSAVLAKTSDRRSTTGLSIYAPAAGGSISSSYLNQYSSFFTATGWRSFLESFVGGSAPRSIPNDFTGRNQSPGEAFDLRTIIGAGNQFSQLSLDPLASGSTQSDWFQFGLAGTGTAADRVVVTLASGSGAARVRLTDINGTELSNVQGSSGEIIVSLNGRPAGSYLLEVSSVDGVSAVFYDLRIDAPSVSAGFADWASGNTTPDKSEDLGTLTGDNLFSGLAIAPGDVRWFDFTAERSVVHGVGQITLRTGTGGGIITVLLQQVADDGSTTDLRTVSGSGAAGVVVRYESGTGIHYRIRLTMAAGPAAANGDTRSATDPVGASIKIESTTEGSSLPANVTRLYRGFFQNANFHFFTTSPGQFGVFVAAGNQNETDGQTGIGILSSPTAGALPMFRLYNLSKGNHYYTTSEGERDFLVGLNPPPVSGPDNRTSGWRYEGIEGYLFSEPFAGSTELFKLYNTDSGVHLYTDSVAQKDAILAIAEGGTGRHPWRLENSLGFGYSVGAGFLTPFSTGNVIPAAATAAATAAADPVVVMPTASLPVEADDAEGSVEVSLGLIAIDTGSSTVAASPALSGGAEDVDDTATSAIVSDDDASEVIDTLFTQIGSDTDLVPMF